jgi:hypothetical protein
MKFDTIARRQNYFWQSGKGTPAYADQYCHFATAAEVIRFAVGDLPAVRTSGPGCKLEMTGSIATKSIVNIKAIENLIRSTATFTAVKGNRCTHQGRRLSAFGILLKKSEYRVYTNF